MCGMKVRKDQKECLTVVFSQKYFPTKEKKKIKVVKKVWTTEIIGSKNRVTIAHCSTIKDRRDVM